MSKIFRPGNPFDIFMAEPTHTSLTFHTLWQSSNYLVNAAFSSSLNSITSMRPI